MIQFGGLGGVGVLSSGDKRNRENCGRDGQDEVREVKGK